jgi:sulfide:quinone oxidoreductase
MLRVARVRAYDSGLDAGKVGFRHSSCSVVGVVMKDLVIVGAGTAGTMMANKLVALLPQDWRVTVVDKDDDHVYQPGLLFVPFGDYRPEELVRSRRRYLDPRVRVLLEGFETIDGDAKVVHLGQGGRLRYDVLIIATGCTAEPAQTPGLTGTGWKQDAFDFYSLDGATALRDHLETFVGGTLVLNVAEMPIKCPVAPLEFVLLAEAFFQKRGLRDEVKLVYATPLDGAFTKPRASQVLGNMLSERGIEVVPDFSVEEVDGKTRRIKAYDGRSQDYNLLVMIPVHVGAAQIRASGLGDAMGFVPTNKHTLQTDAHAEMFAIGDATNLPTSKAGSVAHFQAEVLTKNILSFIAGKELLATFDGHANCFIETGHEKALLIDFNYETEPLPGRFPLPGIGPFSLLQESHINHWGKLAFKWVYWNKLLSGEELPIGHDMVLAGKWTGETRSA